MDDLLLLVMFFLLYNHRKKEIIIGQYLGMGVIIGLSLILSYSIEKLALFDLRYLGIIPIALGVKTFFDKEDEEGDVKSIHSSLIIQLMLLTLLNGTDNIIVYVSLFSSLEAKNLLFCVLIFLMMTAVWCVMAVGLVKHERVRRQLIRYKRWIIPIVLIYVGINVLLG